MSTLDNVVISPPIGYHSAMTQDMTLSRAERNRQQLRADIIQAAFEEFAARGYHQTAIADIAKRLGIGHGTFYRYFQNKRDILEQVINDVMARIMGALAEENAPGAAGTLEDYRGQVARIARRLNEIVAENPAMGRLLLLEATSIDAEMTERVLGLMDWAGQITAAYMENGVRLGFFRQDLDCLATGHAIVGMIIGSILRYLRRPDDLEEQKRLGEAIQRLLVDGVARH